MRLLVLKTVLVATDLDESSMKAVAGARALAAGADAELHVVNVASVPPPNATKVYDFIARAGVAIDAPAVHAVVGDPRLAIGRLADAISADVIVLGPHHHPGGVSQPMTGTALGIVTNSAAPCLIVRDFQIPLTRVVVALDLSETARGALVTGLSWASALRAARARNGGGVTLTAVYVTRRGASDDELAGLTASLDRQVADLREDAGSWSNVTIECKVIAGDDVPQTVARFANDDSADLIVLGTRGLGLDTVGRVGSVAASVAEATNIPTLLVPPAIWLELGRVRPRQRRFSKKAQRAMR